MWITLKLSIEKFVEEEYTNYKERTVRVQVYFFLQWKDCLRAIYRIVKQRIVVRCGN